MDVSPIIHCANIVKPTLRTLRVKRTASRLHTAGTAAVALAYKLGPGRSLVITVLHLLTDTHTFREYAYNVFSGFANS